MLPCASSWATRACSAKTRNPSRSAHWAARSSGCAPPALRARRGVQSPGSSRARGGPGLEVALGGDGALTHAACCGSYFSAHWCPPCRGFTPVLVRHDSACWSGLGSTCDTGGTRSELRASPSVDSVQHRPGLRCAGEEVHRAACSEQSVRGPLPASGPVPFPFLCFSVPTIIFQPVCVAMDENSPADGHFARPTAIILRAITSKTCFKIDVCPCVDRR